MSKKIIVLSDGTGNSSAAIWRTNVWRMFEALDLSGSDQVALYDDGVGTSSFKPLAILGGAFGYGLKRNVIEIYKFICRNHREPTDEIFGFGFSRGAFTIRVVIGLVLDKGLVQAKDEADLDRRAKAAYESYRRRKFHTHWAGIFRTMPTAPLLPDVAPGDKAIEGIRFLGLWDTVAAYGLPVEEMTRGVDKWIWPLELPNRVLSDKVQRACHALALDDERKTFHPVLWDESAQPAPASPDEPRPLNSQPISQVWFSGMHSNVGGGYPEDSLAHISLYWIMNEAKSCGLRFKARPKATPNALITTRGGQDKDGRLYNSRAGFGNSYRYGPRKLVELCDQKLSSKPGDAVKIELPKIHESVFLRIANNAHPSAPLGIPARYEVVTSAGTVVPQVHNPYETAVSAAAREVAQEHIWDLVWCRKIVYALTTMVGIYLVIFPLLGSTPAQDEFTSPVRWISDIIRLAGSILPSAAQPWLNGYARNPIQFALVLVLFASLTALGGRLTARIRNNMGRIWQDSIKQRLTNGSPQKTWIYWFRTHANYVRAHTIWRHRLAPAASAIAVIYLGFALISHVAFVVIDDAGFVCKDAKRAGRAAPTPLMKQGDKRTVEFNSSALCVPTGIMLEEGKRYLIQLKAREDHWYDKGVGGIGSIETSPAGFRSLEAPGWWQRPLMLIAVPLRRELIRPWFRVVARFGGVGGEETFLDPDPKDKSIAEVIRVTRDGELFLFINDAVLGIPGLFDIFYRYNVGTADVTVTRKSP